MVGVTSQIYAAEISDKRSDDFRGFENRVRCFCHRACRLRCLRRRSCRRRRHGWRQTTLPSVATIIAVKIINVRT